MIFVWILAHNILYTYIAPFLASLGLAASLDRALLVFGLASLVGIWFTGLGVDRWAARADPVQPRRFRPGVPAAGDRLPASPGWPGSALAPGA